MLDRPYSPCVRLHRHYCRYANPSSHWLPIKQDWRHYPPIPYLYLSLWSPSLLACLSMDLVSPSDYLCYVRCTYCNIVLAVGVPCRRLMDTVTVNCGHCNHISIIKPRPLVQPHSPDQYMGFQGRCSDCRKHQPPTQMPTSSSSSEQMIPKAPFVVKPPEKKHRLPSAYNGFMREEIQRIKAAKPDIRHREAFSMAAKNWSKCDPRATTTSTVESNGTARKITFQQEKSNGFLLGSFDAFKQVDRN